MKRVKQKERCEVLVDGRFWCHCVKAVRTGDGKELHYQLGSGAVGRSVHWRLFIVDGPWERLAG